jgi:hypothetical protein
MGLAPWPLMAQTDRAAVASDKTRWHLRVNGDFDELRVLIFICFVISIVAWRSFHGQSFFRRAVMFISQWPGLR